MFTLLFILVLIFLCSLTYAARAGAPWVPTWKRDIDRLATLLDLKPGERFFELGCGDGRVSIELAKLSGAHATGVELSLLQWLVAQIRRVLGHHKNVTFVLGNAFNVDLTNADAVYLFLMPATYKKIRPKLERELKPGARVVTYVWPMPDWTPTRVDTFVKAPSLYLYQR